MCRKGLADLPLALIFKVMSQLDAKDIHCLGSSCCFFRALAEESVPDLNLSLYPHQAKPTDQILLSLLRPWKVHFLCHSLNLSTRLGCWGNMHCLGLPPHLDRHIRSVILTQRYINMSVQRAAVRWMIQREECTGGFLPDPCWLHFRTEDGSEFWGCTVTGAFSVEAPRPIWDTKGGFFCDEPVTTSGAKAAFHCLPAPWTYFSVDWNVDISYGQFFSHSETAPDPVSASGDLMSCCKTSHDSVSLFAPSPCTAPFFTIYTLIGQRRYAVETLYTYHSAMRQDTNSQWMRVQGLWSLSEKTDCLLQGLGKTVTGLALILHTYGILPEPPEEYEAHIINTSLGKRVGYYLLPANQPFNRKRQDALSPIAAARSRNDTPTSKGAGFLGGRASCLPDLQLDTPVSSPTSATMGVLGVSKELWSCMPFDPVIMVIIILSYQCPLVWSWENCLACCDSSLALPGASFCWWQYCRKGHSQILTKNLTPRHWIYCARYPPMLIHTVAMLAAVLFLQVIVHHRNFQQDCPTSNSSRRATSGWF